MIEKVVKIDRESNIAAHKDKVTEERRMWRDWRQEVLLRT